MHYAAIISIFSSNISHNFWPKFIVAVNLSIQVNTWIFILSWPQQYWWGWLHFYVIFVFLSPSFFLTLPLFFSILCGGTHLSYDHFFYFSIFPWWKIPSIFLFFPPFPKFFLVHEVFFNKGAVIMAKNNPIIDFVCYFLKMIWTAQILSNLVFVSNVSLNFEL